MWLRWTACLVLGVPAALAIVSLWAAMVAGSRNGRGVSFPLPGVFGVTAAVACRLCPVEAVRSLWWVSLLLDPFLLAMSLALPGHLVARLTGRRSPFDPPDPVS